MNKPEIVVGVISEESLETKLRSLNFILQTRIFRTVSYDLLVDCEISLVVCHNCFCV